jgi:5,10-methylenetetrahydromethanopterin reductase
MLRIGISFDGFSPYQEAVTFAQESVAAGASSLWMADHLGYREAILSCLGLALATSDVLVVPTALSPYLRHPVPTAMQMATLAEAAPGRAALAVGIGNPLFLGEAGETIEKPVRVMREFVEALRSLWSGEPVRQEALRFRLNGSRMMFKPPQPIPIYLAPMREQILQLAGKIADGVVLSAGLSTQSVRWSFDQVQTGMAAAKRTGAAFRSAGYISFMAAREKKHAVEAVRQKLAFLLRNQFMAENLRRSGIPIDQDAIIEAMSRRDFAAAASLVPDEAVETFAVAGTVQECCQRLQAFGEAGLQDAVLLLAGTLEDQRYGLQVLRAFSSKA